MHASSSLVYLVSKSGNNAHETLVFGLTNDAQSLMQILYETHLFLGLTCVIQALAKHSLTNNTMLAKPGIASLPHQARCRR